MYSLRFWIVLVLTGIGTGIAGGLLMKLLRACEHFAWFYHSGNFLSAAEKTSAAHRVVVLLSAGLLSGGVMWIIRRATKEHGGDLSAAIWFRSGQLPLARSLARAVLSIVIVALGASLGREAAPKEAGAAFASKLSHWFRISPSQRRLLVACGAGAGMAAVYNVPVGGALFGVEVLLGSIALPLVIPAITASCIATAVSWLLLPNRPTYKIPTYGVSLGEILWAVFAGPLIGAASVLYVRAISWAGTHKPKPAGTFLSPVLLLPALGAISIVLPQLLGNGKDVVQLSFLGGIGLALAACLVIAKPVVTAGCLVSGAPGGLFTPTMTTGALLGAILGSLWGYWWQGMPLGIPAILGSGAFLAATMDAPIASILLLLDLTRHIEDLMAPLMFVVAGSIIVKRIFEPRSIYSGRIQIHEAPPAAGTAFDDLLSDNYLLVPSAISYSVLLEGFVAAHREDITAFVIDENDRLLGQIPAARIQRQDVREFLSPYETATAGDLAVPADTLAASSSREAALEKIAETTGPVAVIDPTSQHFLGVLYCARPVAQ
jgi:CIC family chloride channel protein